LLPKRQRTSLKQAISQEHIDPVWLENHPEMNSETYIDLAQGEQDTPARQPPDNTPAASEAGDHPGVAGSGQYASEDQQRSDDENKDEYRSPAPRGLVLPQWRWETPTDNDMYTNYDPY
jgi:hypothetical protein